MLAQNKIIIAVPFIMLVVTVFVIINTNSFSFTEGFSIETLTPKKVFGFCGIFLALFAVTLYVLDAIFKFQWTCTNLGWHDGKGESLKKCYNDGCNNHSVCSKCGKEVMKDSQGNWF